MAPKYPLTRRVLSFALVSTAFSFTALVLSWTAASSVTAQNSAAQPSAPSANTTASSEAPANEPADVAAFRASVGGAITPLVIELKDDPGVLRKIAAEQLGLPMSVADIGNYALDLYAKQSAFIAQLAARGVRALPRMTDAEQIDGSIRRVEYRMTYVLNGFVAYVADADIPALRALPEVAHVSEAQSPVYFLDQAIDHSLGTNPSLAQRRTAVYGATQEFGPATDDAAHPEKPRTTKADGYEGQNIITAVIDSGVDWRHPMFGGTGHGLVDKNGNGVPDPGEESPQPLPRVSGQPASAADNKKVIYYYAFGKALADPTDDYGHGTHVASTVAGYGVDGNTPIRFGFGAGKTGTGVGPTLNNEQLFGSAPQAMIMSYKVCGPNNLCPGDIPLAIDDAASPVTLISAGSTGPQAVAKPVADVINLSLGNPDGDAASAQSRAVNNAALAGTIVVTSAGNNGPGAATIGNPGAATLAIAVAAGLDPGSLSSADVLAADQIPGETRAPAPGPSPETGAASVANAFAEGERKGMRIFPVAGGGPIPDKSLSAHYVYVERREVNGEPAPPVPPAASNRIALVKFSGAFAAAANAVATQVPPPAAILLITSTENATAVAVVNGVPTFAIGIDDGNYLIDRMRTGDAGDADDNVDVPNGTVSELPLRLNDRPPLDAFLPGVVGFSSRGPSDHANANFRMVKPDVIAPGFGVVAAATVDGSYANMASPNGYITANGTSMASPITAGAMALIRQRLRELDLDSTDPAQRTKRFDTVTIARAMLQNASTNLRDGVGTPQGDGAASVASINDMGSGHINIADALAADAIMVSPSSLLTTPAEFTGNAARTVLIPTASFGAVPVVRLNDTIVRTREVIIRDITGQGGGTYNLSWQNNRLADHPGFGITITAAADSVAPISSIEVPAGGSASFFVRVTADGTQINLDPSDFQWYVTATHSGGKTLRMPFLFHAVTALVPNSAAPTLQPMENTESATTPCPTDTNGSYTARFAYTGPAAVGFRLQEATASQTLFFDDGEELMQPNVIGTTAVTENSKWRDVGISGTPQTPPMWSSQVNPDSQTRAYFIPGGQGQNHSLTMKNTITLPNTAITLSFRTRVQLDRNVDFGYAEITTDNVNWTIVHAMTGGPLGTGAAVSSTPVIDLSGYAGQTVRLRFRLVSPQTSVATNPGPSWHVEDIRIDSDNYQTVADTDASARTVTLTNRPAGTYSYRVAALYANPNPLDLGTIIIGPFSNERCVTVAAGPAPISVVSRKAHGAGTFAINLPLTGPSGIECRTGGQSGDHQVVFSFGAPVTFTSGGGAAVEAPKGGSVSNVSISGSEVTVNLTGVANAQVIRLTLTGVSDGSTTGSVSAPMGVLLGDTTGDRFTDAGDISQTKSRSGRAVTVATFRSDVTADGFLDAGDISLVKSKSGTALPPE